MSDVLERMYREEFRENLPENWDQLLGVFSYFIFDKLAANKVVIYLVIIFCLFNNYREQILSYYCSFIVQNDTESNQQNGHEDTNEDVADEQSFVPGTPLLFEDHIEKSILVSANYGATSIWIRLVGQSADVSIFFNHFANLQNNNRFTKSK